MALETVKTQAEELRLIYPRVLAKTLAFTKSLPEAEDAVQEAVARALESWPRTGAPASAEAWLVAVAANCHRDRIRRSQREDRNQDALATLAEMSPWVRIGLGEPEIASGWKDDLLRLLFACCHPVLNSGESAALALATVIGLSTSEIAAAFVVTPRTMEQRLTRARQRLRAKGDYEGAPPGQARDRIAAVLRTVHLLFNEGYWSSDDGPPIRGDLCRLAIGLAHALLSTFPDVAEAGGLLALFLLHDARRIARLDERGVPVPLPEQDRSRWDRASIAAALELLERTLALGAPGPLQIEAAISAIHCRAPSAEATDWREIAKLYALLESFRSMPAVRVNRAFAVAKAEGAAAGLALLDDPELVGDYPYQHLVRGTLLAELGRSSEAHDSLRKAKEHARNAHEAAQIDAIIERLNSPHQG